MPKCTSATFASFIRLTSTPNRKTSTMFHGSQRYIHLATTERPRRRPPDHQRAAHIDHAARQHQRRDHREQNDRYPQNGGSSSIKAVAAPTSVRFRRIVAASIVRNGNACTSTIRNSAASENAVALTSEAGRF